MGIVYRAEDRMLKRPVAIKEIVFPARIPEEELEALRERALREARAAARLTHPSAVMIYDAVEEDESIFVVMELVPGSPLDERVKRDGPLDVSDTGRIALDLIGVLELAHSAGIVHRDVKPGNVMTPDGGPAKLADFGIASVQDDPKITTTGLILGSPSYMAPEQATGTQSIPATDAWGLGATMYFALEGKPPFDRGDAIPTLASVVKDDPPRPVRSGTLEPIVMSLLEKDPARRATLADARTAIEDAIGTREPVVETQKVEPPSMPSASRGSRRLVPLLVVSVIAAMLAAFAFLGPDDKEPPPQQDEESEQSAIPADWVSYQDPETGYRLMHPSDWEVEQIDTRTDFQDPTTGAYLRVDWTDSPGSDPVAAWDSLEDSFATTHDDYEQIRIDHATYKGFDAAEWEFTYTDSGAALHALDLGFITEQYGFALFFQTHAEDWESMQDEFEAFKESFEPPG
jgi:eukaryotic-like serine/threonine-protein kinase